MASSSSEGAAADFLGDLSPATAALLKDEKLALFLDIDNTILHAIVSYDIPYTLFTNSATKDMFVFQMETPKPELPPRRDTTPSRRHPPDSPSESDNLVFNLDAIKSPPKTHQFAGVHGLPSRLEHSSDILRNSQSSAISASCSDTEALLIEESSSSDDSDNNQSIIGNARIFHMDNSRSGSAELGSDTASNSSSTSRKGSYRLGDLTRNNQARSRTPNVEIFDESEAQDFVGKPLYCLVKPRPGIISFLRSARNFFRIYVCTFGSLEYASEIRTRLNALVAKGDKTPQPPALESQIIAREAHRRIVAGVADVQACAGSETEGLSSRQELCSISPPATPSPRPYSASTNEASVINGDPPVTVVQPADAGTDAQAQQPPLAQTLRKSLKTILSSLKMDIDERLCVCLDDRLDVWAPEDVERNVLKIHPYSFFFSHPIYELQAAEHGLHRHFFAAPPKLNLDLTSLNDDALRASWMTLSTIHRKFFARLNSFRTPNARTGQDTAPSTISALHAQTVLQPSAVNLAAAENSNAAQNAGSGASPSTIPTDTSASTTTDNPVPIPSIVIPTPATASAPVSASAPTAVVTSNGTRTVPQFDVLPRAFLPSVQAYLASFRLPILRGVILAHQGKLVRDILHLASYFGATILESFDNTATHFLVSSIDSDTCRQVRERMKNDQAFNQQVQVVTCSWITDCARDCRRIPETPYILSSRYQ